MSTFTDDMTDERAYRTMLQENRIYKEENAELRRMVSEMSDRQQASDERFASFMERLAQKDGEIASLHGIVSQLTAVAEGVALINRKLDEADRKLEEAREEGKAKDAIIADLKKKLDEAGKSQRRDKFGPKSEKGRYHTRRESAADAARPDVDTASPMPQDVTAPNYAKMSDAEIIECINEAISAAEKVESEPCRPHDDASGATSPSVPKDPAPRNLTRKGIKYRRYLNVDTVRRLMSEGKLPVDIDVEEVHCTFDKLPEGAHLLKGHSSYVVIDQKMKTVFTIYQCDIASDNCTEEIAPLPDGKARKTEKGKWELGPDLLARILVDKHLYAMSDGNIIRRLHGEGVMVGKSTYCGEVQRAMRILSYLDKTWLQDMIDHEYYLDADETTMMVGIEKALEGEEDGGKKGTVRDYIRKFIVCIQSMTRGMAYFKYKNGQRTYEVVSGLLEGYSGALHTDGLKVYETLSRLDKEITVLGCHAHVRRRFVPVADEGDSLAIGIRDMIDEVYHYEHICDGQHMSPALRTLYRYQHSIPKMQEIRAKLEEVEAMIKGGGYVSEGLKDAVAHALREWDALMRCYRNGEYRLDNNRTEAAQKPIAQVRKICQNIGSEAVAGLRTFVFSIVETCSRMDMNPIPFISFLLKNLKPGMADYAPFLPENYLKTASAGR